MDWTTKPIPGGVLLSFDIPNGVLEPGELSRVVGEFGALAPEYWGGGIVLSGRGPVWLYAALVHEAHPAAWVATHEPRRGAGVVVSRHREDAPALGELVPLE